MKDNLKISGLPPGQMGPGRIDRSENLSRPKEHHEAPEAVPSPAVDNVQLSSRARELSRVKEVIAQSDAELRREKVTPLQAQVAQGRYRVEGELVANSLLRSFLQESQLPQGSF